jgi:hypothetical protein
MNTETVKQEELPIPAPEKHPNFFQQILKVNAAAVTLQYLFDNIRNYTLATTVVIAGIWLLSRGDSIFGIPYINLVFGIHVVICGLILIGLNFIHSILTIAKIPGKPWPAYIIFLTLLVSSLEVVWISFWKFYN